MKVIRFGFTEIDTNVKIGGPADLSEIELPDQVLQCLLMEIWLDMILGPTLVDLKSNFFNLCIDIGLDKTKKNQRKIVIFSYP